MVLIFAGAVLGPVVYSGSKGLSWEYLASEPLRMGLAGGIGPILVSTLVINGMAVLVTTIIGLPASMFLHLATKGSFAKPLRSVVNLSLDLLAATPSIVYGLFGHAFFSQTLGLGYSLISGMLTLSIMILPLFVRLCADAFGETPLEFLILAQSLRLSKRTYCCKIILPMALPAVITAIILSWTRAIGEAAALLFTAGYSMRWPESLGDSGRTLAVHIFDLSLNISGANQMVNQAALVLLALSVAFVLTLRITVKGVSRWRSRRHFL